MNSDKVDLVMWTKNGRKTLPYVLRQINWVIPKSAVQSRLIVDDGSSDGSTTIAKELGWSVYSNEGHGISDGANTALKHVESDRFVSFEQDVFLSPLWWDNIPKLLEGNTIAASGVRFPTQPKALRDLDEYFLCLHSQELYSDSFHFGMTIDNTIYRTASIRKIGGFPRITKNAIVDNVLRKRVFDAGFKWKVNYDVKSMHIRDGLRDELRHCYWYGASFNYLTPYLTGIQLNIWDSLRQFLNSPVYGAKAAIKMNSPELIYMYPLIKLAEYCGLTSERRENSKKIGKSV